VNRKGLSSRIIHHWLRNLSSLLISSEISDTHSALSSLHVQSRIAMNYSQPYWNPILETLSPETLRALQLKKFQRIFRWAYTHSKFHRALYQAAGVAPEDIRTFDDIRRVPTVEKSMMRQIQGKDPYPYGDALCVPLEEVAVYRQTSGTTGQPVYQPDTWQDWEWWAECWCYILWAQGYRPSDRVFIPFGYNVFVAFWAGHYAAEKLGCEVVPGGVLDTKARILKVQELRATALMGTPTYILSMAETARLKMGIDPSGLSVNKITCAGECGASIPSTKRRMEEAWGAKVYDHAGATEIGAWSYECAAQPGGLHVNEAMFLVEIIDPETGQSIEEPGRRGKMVITAFDRQAPVRTLRLKGDRMGGRALCLRPVVSADPGRGGGACGRHHQGQGRAARAVRHRGGGSRPQGPGG
jgi:phenylacetate-CoA ligase